MDSKVFFLCSTALGAGIGYLVGRSADNNAGFVQRVGRVFGASMSMQAACTATGAIIGASVGFMYWYVETVVSLISYVARAAMNNPKTSAGIAIGLLVVVVLAANDDSGRTPPTSRKR